ncbi:S-methyl-5'-thioadenosine phosphorylase [Nitrospira tepida]|uniref:S-methyl-5'-thioadenosine phosphorylase n=1 Tax=Nitrospira tepida TaxID=2973512 RepID=A0AA86T7J6_9BACT|nr:S-methyl-5'-thioadenosine phosphorylase [Nitrospira tepida]CAI4033047.1 S-methyl-5'-thioadenosine phosphorylase [Nitrospira tepida]
MSRRSGAGQARADIGIIGGSGLYEMEGLTQVREARIKTPFGDPSGPVILGQLEGRRVAFLARHGQGHRFSPSTINYRANIYALKAIGVSQVLSVSAVGSMRETIQPGHVVLPDQFLDWTKRRASTFFDADVVAHVGLAEPVCGRLGQIVEQATRSVGAVAHRGGSYLCIEGPQFSTKAESHLYRSWHVSVIGMTNMPEAKLAREAELCYATIALVTDYDCWHETEEAVQVEAILTVLRQNVLLAKRLLREVVGQLEEKAVCGCQQALKGAIITAPEAIPAAARTRLHLLIGRYIEAKKGRG